MIRAALIDMDGTLYDSMPFHTLAWERVAREIGMPIPRNEFYLYEGMTGESIINMLAQRELGKRFTKEEAHELYLLKAQYFREYGEPKLIEGAKETVDFLLEAGVKCVLVTGSGQHSLLDRLESDFPGAFPESLRITSKNVTHCKPHPEPFLKGAEIARVAPENCIGIDNAPLGVESSSQSGAYTIGVQTGPIPAHKFIEAGADAVLPSMKACHEYLKKSLKWIRK